MAEAYVCKPHGIEESGLAAKLRHDAVAKVAAVVLGLAISRHLSERQGNTQHLQGVECHAEIEAIHPGFSNAGSNERKVTGIEGEREEDNGQHREKQTPDEKGSVSF